MIVHVPVLPSILLALASSVSSVSSAPVAQPRVILVTLDGVRFHDVIGDERAIEPGAHPTMPALWERATKGGVLFEPGNATVRTSSLVPLSLPGYLALMQGGTTRCYDNKCGRTESETLPEEIARRLSLSSSQVAVFASWGKIARAATSRDGAVTVDIAREGPVHDGGPPWPDARFDDDTIKAALGYLERVKPRFMWLSLLDTDERAHRGEKALTVAALKEADDALARIFAFVDALPPEERAVTTVMVTTDHGRGDGASWTEHGLDTPAARDIWLAAVGEPVRSSGRRPAAKSVTQADVRPTILRALGLCVRAKVIDDVVARAPPCAR